MIVLFCTDGNLQRMYLNEIVLSKYQQALAVVLHGSNQGTRNLPGGLSRDTMHTCPCRGLIPFETANSIWMRVLIAAFYRSLLTKQFSSGTVVTLISA